MASPATDNVSAVASEESLSTEDDDEELELLTLRFKFNEKPFSRVWQCLQAAGWTHRSRQYQAPNKGEVFEGATELCDYLDQYAIPDIYSSLQASTPIDTDDEGQRLRRQALHHWHLKQKDKGQQPQADSDSSNEEKDTTKQRKAAPSRPRRSTGTATTTNNRGSVTATEKGSDLYLHKNTKGRKKKPPQMPVENNESDTPLLRPSLDECAKLIQDYSLEPVIAKEESYKPMFPHWRFLLSTNHSLLFFGAGSKRTLLESFSRLELDKEGYALMINGYDQQVNISAILDLLVMLFLDGEEPEPSAAIPLSDNAAPVLGISNPWRAHALVERAIAIGRALARVATDTLIPIFLVIHNLEGLNTTIAQDALAALIVNSHVENGVYSVRLVASVDHVDASLLLWNVPTSTNFCWIYQQVDTHRPYVEELVLIEEPIRRKKVAKQEKRQESQAARVLIVLKNLAPRHAEVVQILAKLQLESSTGWVDFLVYRDRCKKACAVSRDSQLRQYMMELKDHGLMVTKLEESKELVRVPYSDAKLQEILAYKLAN